jgi:rubredoxin
VTAGRIILRVREVLGSGVLLLEGRDGKLWKNHTRNYVPCHLPHIDGTVHPGTSHIPASLRCRLCGSAKRVAAMVICDTCSTGWHLECLTPPLLEVPVGQWACPECVRHSRGQ